MSEPVVPLIAVLHADRVTLEVLDAEAKALLDLLHIGACHGGSWGVSFEDRRLIMAVRDRLFQAVEAKKK